MSHIMDWCFLDCNPEPGKGVIDYFSGLPIYNNFVNSPFFLLKDYQCYLNQFKPVSSCWLDRSYSAIFKCLDGICFEHKLRMYIPRNLLTLSFLACEDSSLMFIEQKIYEALAVGQFSRNPSDYKTIFNYCTMLKNANLYMCTFNILREVIKRDCVEAFKIILEVFGDDVSIPGTVIARSKFFKMLRQHLILFRSIHIKKYVFDKIMINIESNTSKIPYDKIYFPSPFLLHSVKNNYMSSLIHSELSFPLPETRCMINNSHFISERSSKKISYIYCPFQKSAFPFNIHCSCVAGNRWYSVEHVTNFDLCSFVEPSTIFPPN